MDNEIHKRQNVNEQDAVVDNKNALYHGNNSVSNTSVNIHNNYQDESNVYAIEKGNDLPLRVFSKLVLKILGERNAMIAGYGLPGLAILLMVGIVTRTPAFLPELTPPVAYANIAMIVLGAGLLSAVQYKRNRDCVSCGADYVLEEVGTPTRRDVPTVEGVRRTTKRHYRCTACGHTDSREHSGLLSRDQPA